MARRDKHTGEVRKEAATHRTWAKETTRALTISQPSHGTKGSSDVTTSLCCFGNNALDSMATERYNLLRPSPTVLM